MTTELKRFSTTYWMGSEESALEARRFQMNIEANSGKWTASTTDATATDVPWNVTVQGGVAIISISGPLTDRASPWDSYMQISSYNEISKALMWAAESADVQRILLDVNSGGGAVAGVEDTGNLIQKVREIKPVDTFTGGTMASAAYWLGMQGEHVYAAKTAIVGSIGVIATHMEYSRAMSDAGVGVTVIRAGKFKALANSMEPLSKEGEAGIQAQLDTLEHVFVEAVAEARHTTYENAYKNMAQGKEFIGKDALTAGLVDGITTFDTLLAQLQADVIDKTATSAQNQRNTHQEQNMTTRRTLSATDAVAIAAGVTLPTAETELTAEEIAAAAAASAEGVTTEVTTEATIEATTEIVAAAPTDAAIPFLQGQLKEAQAEIVALKVAAANDSAKLVDMETTHKGLCAVVGASVNQMRIALGLSPLDMSASTGASLLAEHTSAAKQFTQTFKVGGVAAVDATTEQSAQSNAPILDGLYQARLAATRI